MYNIYYNPYAKALSKYPYSIFNTKNTKEFKFSDSLFALEYTMHKDHPSVGSNNSDMSKNRVIKNIKDIPSHFILLVSIEDPKKLSELYPELFI